MSGNGESQTEELREELRSSLFGIKDQVDQIRGDQADNDLQTAERLTTLETQLNEIGFRVSLMENHSGLDESQVLLNEVRQWSQFCHNLGLEEAVEGSDILGQKLAEDRLLYWKEYVDSLGESPDPRLCFRALMLTTTMGLEASRLEGRTDREIELLDEIRQDLRERFVRALEQQPPEEKIRDEWVSSLRDRAVSVLADLVDMPPKIAAEQLRMVEKDVSWHLQHVEPTKGERNKILKKKARRLEIEWQERVLQKRMESTFGRAFVNWSERLLFFLTFLVLVLLLVEFLFEKTLSKVARDRLIYADTTICGMFLLEFFTKLAMVPKRLDWAWRHFLMDFLPAIPFGIIGLHAADPVRAGRLARLLRLPRFARYLRVARGLIRIIRVIGFMTRGLDRLARLYAPLLKFKVILYPNREERQKDRDESVRLNSLVRRLRGRLNERWQHLLVSSEPERRPAIALARLQPLEMALADGFDRLPIRFDKPQYLSNDRIAERLIYQLTCTTPEDVTLQLGENLTSRLARIIRILSKPPIRWLPIFRSCVPHVGVRTTDAEVMAETAKNLGKVLGKWHNRWFWWADLYGTVTPTQFIDRLGTTLVRSAIRPATRLTMFGLFFLVTEGLLSLVRMPLLADLRNFLLRYLGLPIVLLGAICGVVVGIGFWLQRLAQEATEYYEESVAAQFLHLTEVIRPRFMERDAKFLFDRVVLPERKIMNKPVDQKSQEHERKTFVCMTNSWLMGRYSSNQSKAAFDPMERVVLLYRDSLDGALLADSDTRTTSQLLGNPAIRRMRTWSRRFDRYDEKALQKLTLTRQKSLFGPYLWFYLLTRAVSLQTAQLLMDYNRNAIPLAELETATQEDRERFDKWLETGEFDPRFLPIERKEDQYEYVVTTAFTALHFLDDDPERDEEVRQRFGEAILSRLQRDRSLLIRRVFGTYPLHQRDQDDRVIDLESTYQAWLGGGRVFLLPVFLLGQGITALKHGFYWIIRCLKEMRSEGTNDANDAAEADFPTAVRKIDRMRGPIVEASTRLRSLLDPEYLGVPLPGHDHLTILGSDVVADCHLLNFQPEFREELQANRSRAECDMQRLSDLMEDGLLERVAEKVGVEPETFRTSEHIRASAVAYLADYLAVRRLLSAPEILHEVYRKAKLDDPLPMRPWLFFRLGWMFRTYCKRFNLRDRDARLAAWRATIHNVDDVADALQVWYRNRDDEGARKKGEAILADLLRHPARITETLVTLRGVQTLAVLDVVNYREHIYRLGNYAADNDVKEGVITAPSFPSEVENPVASETS